MKCLHFIQAKRSISLPRRHHGTRRVLDERAVLGATSGAAEERRRVEEHQHHAQLHPEHGGEDEASARHTATER